MSVSQTVRMPASYRGDDPGASELTPCTVSAVFKHCRAK